MKGFRTAALAAVLTVCSSFAQGQTLSDLISAFSGEWYSFDRVRAQSGGVCEIDLTTETLGNLFVARSKSCGAGLDLLGAWGIADGQIVLLTEDQRTLGVLGGNQTRMTGDDLASGRSLILERRQPSGFVITLQQAIRNQSCLYVGYTADCSDKTDVAQLLAAKADATVPLTTAARLNLRNQPRRDAPVALVLDRLTQVSALECLTASDGIWCKVDVDGTVGWLARNGLRQQKWAVTTFELATEGPVLEVQP